MPWRLLIFSSFIFLLAILAYAGMSFGYANYLNTRISNQDQTIDALTKKVTPEAQGIFVDFYSRLTNFNNLLADHIYASKVFPMMERITTPSVYYDNFDLNIADRRLILSGLASSFDALSQQLYLYDRESLAEGYILNQSRLVEGLVNFKVTLILSPKLFAK